MSFHSSATVAVARCPASEVGEIITRSARMVPCVSVRSPDERERNPGLAARFARMSFHSSGLRLLSHATGSYAPGDPL